MKLDNNKLAEILISNGMAEVDATDIATNLYETTSNVMFKAILWGYAKFGKRATRNISLIQDVMYKGQLNEFQAIAKIVHQELDVTTA